MVLKLECGKKRKKKKKISVGVKEPVKGKKSDFDIYRVRSGGGGGCQKSKPSSQ